MSLKTQLLRPVAFLAGHHALRQVNGFRRAHNRAADVQAQLLREMLGAFAATDFGRDHDLASVRTYEDFVHAVPVGNYDTLRPYIERVLCGQTTALVPPGERVLMFSQTSGTTGSPKYIPVTSRVLTDTRRGWNVWGLRALQDHKNSWLRAIMQISSSMQESQSPRGLPCGAVSGLLAATQKRIVRGMYCVPLGVSDIADSDSRFYTILRCGIDRDVAFITTANPSSTIKLIEVGQRHVERLLRDVRDGTLTPPGEVSDALRKCIRRRPNPALTAHLERSIARDGQLLPRHFWRLAFLGNWTGGTLGLYMPRLRELFGDVPIRDIGLLASEGRFSVPMDDGTPAGVAEITGNFLEFIPADQYTGAEGLSAARPLRVHELDIGAEYFVVATNWSGLWRYSMDDRVRVVGRLGQSPVIEFLSRGLHTANITGEKITEHQVVKAMATAAARCGASVERFVMQGRFAARPYYELRLEPQDGLDLASLTRQLDESLCELNVEYKSKRKSDRLGPIEATLLRQGTLDTAEQEAIIARRGRSEQYKHKYLLTEIVKDQ